MVSKQYVHEAVPIPTPKAYIPPSHGNGLAGERQDRRSLSSVLALHQSWTSINCSLLPSPLKGCNLPTSVKAWTIFPMLSRFTWLLSGRSGSRLWNGNIKQACGNVRQLHVLGKHLNENLEGYCKLLTLRLLESYLLADQSKTNVKPAAFTWG